MKTIVFDIDGTLADISHRIQFAQAKEWDEFHSRCLDDLVFQNVADLMLSLWMNFEIVLLTGRPEKYRGVTEQWLRLAKIDSFCDDLIMRPDDNYEPDAQMKISALESKFGKKQDVLSNVLAVFDDRESVVEGLRNYGLTVLQPAPGGY